MTIQDMPRLVHDEGNPQITHSLWCQEHKNEDPWGSPESGLCTMSFTLEFPAAPTMDSVRTATAELSFAACDLATEYEPSFVFLSVNGGHETQIEAWKAAPVAYVLLAAEAQHRGDTASASSFHRMARSAIAQHAGDAIRDRMETVDRARYSAEYREGMLAAYREAGRLDMVPALLEDMDYLDRFSPDEPPSMNRASVLPTTRTAPDGTILDLTRPLIDRNGKAWFFGGYSVTGHPLLLAHPEFREYWPVEDIWEKSGPFTQGTNAPAFPAEVYEAALAVAPDVPAFIVQPGTERGTRRVVAVSTGKPVNDTVYTDADGNAPFELRDRLNALPRRQVTA